MHPRIYHSFMEMWYKHEPLLSVYGYFAYPVTPCLRIYSNEFTILPSVHPLFPSADEQSIICWGDAWVSLPVVMYLPDSMVSAATTA